MNLDPLLLSRLQWVWVIPWQILLPAFTVGLASYIAVVGGGGHHDPHGAEPGDCIGPGRYDTVRPLPLTVFGIPDDASGTMRYAVEIPVLGSLLLTHSMDGTIQGLDSFAADQSPPVGRPFFGFRLMVGIAVIMLFVAAAGEILRRGGRLYRSAWFLLLCQWTAPLGFVAVIAAWATTEVGRQPWTVYGLLRTAHSVTPSLTGTDVAMSLSLYLLVYLIMFPTGIAFMASIYVSLDGVDLGVGMLHGLVQPSRRETVMNSIGPFWDGNETWLILGGVMLLAAFPVAFAIIIPAVYFPILIMLLALVFHGVRSNSGSSMCVFAGYGTGRSAAARW